MNEVADLMLRAALKNIFKVAQNSCKFFSEPEAICRIFHNLNHTTEACL